MTPLGKKFAPSYASPHSLIADTINKNAEVSIKCQKNEILSNLAPNNEQIL